MLALVGWLACISTFAASSPEGNKRKAPPPGMAVPREVRVELQRRVEELGGQIEQLRVATAGKPGLLELLADVRIFHKAADWALTYDEFYRTNEFEIARQLLEQGLERARALRSGRAPWVNATGLVVRGFISRIDGSVQPYGLVVPSVWASQPERSRRLDVWLHGRDDHLTELKFLTERQRSFGEFAPPDTFVLHPYGRFCNAFKFAGEVDVLEALDHVQRIYRIDARRVGLRGFSMGGAGCWHLAVHYPGRWTAAAPGAGFAETAEYTRILSKEPQPPWYEQRLWHLYDATDYAANLLDLPLIAYNGELDKQKQAADVMAKAMRAEGLVLQRLVGPNTAHRYEPETKKKLARRFDEMMERGRDSWPTQLRFTTWTLRYNNVAWLRLEKLEKHWERAQVEAEALDDGTVRLTTTNVAALALDLSRSPFRATGHARVVLDGRAFEFRAPDAGSAWLATCTKEAFGWSVRGSLSGAYKRPGLQGPIDDAFMDSFIMVRPTGEPMSEKMGAWVTDELAHATNEWRAQFRGQSIVKTDWAITEADMAASNLVLWGDPRSNKILARILDQLPLRWTETEVRMAGRRFAASRFVPVLIFPNPLNPQRYVVLNAGFTFCESGDASNALQTPKLPDYAVVDTEVPRAARLTQGIAHAGFFNEEWK
jgi:pimeloyl-ACP methyl ester carboxylesterase